MKAIVKYLMSKGITNPSGIVSCLYTRGVKGKYNELRALVIKDIDRINKES